MRTMQLRMNPTSRTLPSLISTRSSGEIGDAATPKQDNINEERVKARRHLGKLARGLADAIQKKSKALAAATMSRPWADKLNSKVKQKLKSKTSAKLVALIFKPSALLIRNKQSMQIIQNQ